MSIVNVPRQVLLSVSKPARYVGGEWNSVNKKNPKNYHRFAFCFPDTYEIGMSHLGMKILYHMLNEREDTFCERFFSPWVDMQDEMEKNNIPLFSLETKTSLDAFDIIGFTLQYEMSYTNVLHMLKLGNVPLYSSERDKTHPIVIAGGPCTFNIEPMADFFDIVFIGESEEQLALFMDLYGKEKKNKKLSRIDFLLLVTQKIPGAYVPAFYDVLYNEDGTIKSVTPNIKGAPEKIKKAIVLEPDKSFFPVDTIVPNIEIVHDRVAIELFRGCLRGCRFCQAGFITRPVRDRSPETLLQTAIKSQNSTGYDEIGLLSLSTGDYPHLNELAKKLLEQTKDTHTGISLPSLRLDSFNEEILQNASQSRKSGLTFAPEAGTQRLRDVINKNITEKELFESMKIAFSGGRSSVKLYFMMGLPTETDEDIDGISKLVYEIIDIYKNTPSETRRRKLEISVSVAIFVPKPFTPFQWEPQDLMENLESKQTRLKGLLRNKNIKFNPNISAASIWEAVLARGDRRLSGVIYKAFSQGCGFESWDEMFHFNKYVEIMEDEGLDISFYANRKREYDEVLPWNHIDSGVSLKYLIKENENAQSGIKTKDCRTACSNCGAANFGGGVCYEN